MYCIKLFIKFTVIKFFKCLQSILQHISFALRRLAYHSIYLGQFMQHNNALRCTHRAREFSLQILCKLSQTFRCAAYTLLQLPYYALSTRSTDTFLLNLKKKSRAKTKRLPENPLKMAHCSQRNVFSSRWKRTN